jgi:hypothetical protein
MADEQHSEEVQRWTAKRRAALVLSLLKGETTTADATRRHGLKVAEVEEWRERFLLGAENSGANALCTRQISTGSRSGLVLRALRPHASMTGARLGLREPDTSR